VLQADANQRTDGIGTGFIVCTTPSYSPESNGMAEAFVKTFKRDYVYLHRRESASSVMAQLPTWFGVVQLFILANIANTSRRSLSIHDWSDCAVALASFQYSRAQASRTPIAAHAAGRIQIRRAERLAVG
jgi:hypothetical protein